VPFRARKAKKDVVRLYIVSDFHASAPAWRKMLNAIRLNVYKADAVLYAGDLTGKAIVPVLTAAQRAQYADHLRHVAARESRG